MLISHTADKTIHTHKDLLRFFLRQQRSRRLAAIEAKAELYSKNLHELVSSYSQQTGKEKLVIAAYLPLKTEPPITLALRELDNLGHRILVPVVLPQRQLGWVFWTPQIPLNTNALGICEPTGKRFGPEKFIDADLRLIPALAYDSAGRRLGQGGGYYDRLLEKTAAEAGAGGGENIGLVFDSEILDGLPHQDWDAQLSAVLTETGIRQLGCPQAQ